MTEKFSQLATNIPLDNDPNKQYPVINGYPVVLSFAKEANTETGAWEFVAVQTVEQ